MSKEKHSVGIVFFGGSGKYEKLDDVTLNRLEQAYNLFYSDQIQHILVTGGNRLASTKSGAEKLAEWLLVKGVPAKHILIDSCSYDTVSNLINSFNLLKKHPANSIICN